MKIIDVDKKKKEVAIETEACEAEEAVASEKKSIADTIAKDCETELNKVMPIYYSAMKAVKEIKPADITELGSFA